MKYLQRHNYRFLRSFLAAFLILLSTPNVIGQQATEELRDPFSSALPEETPEIEEMPRPELPISLPKFNIEALVWTTPYPQAIVNGKILGIGDTIEGAKIVDISKSGIDLIYEGRLFRLPSPALESLRKKEEEE